MGPGLAEVAPQNLTETGPWFTHHLKMDPNVFDLEICVPVKSPVSAKGRVKPGQLTARKIARTVYRGPYEGLGAAWAEFGGGGAEARARPLEVYVAGPETGKDPASWRTELNQPLMTQSKVIW
jgi:effector-binding domain-containing protein